MCSCDRDSSKCRVAREIRRRTKGQPGDSVVGEMVGILEIANLQASAASDAVQGNSIAAEHRLIRVQINCSKNAISVDGMRPPWTVRRNGDIALAVLPGGRIDSATSIQRLLNARRGRTNCRSGRIRVVGSERNRPRTLSGNATSRDYLDCFTTSAAGNKHLIPGPACRINANRAGG